MRLPNDQDGLASVDILTYGKYIITSSYVKGEERGGYKR